MGKTKLAVLVTLVAAASLAAATAVASTNKSSSISLRTTKVGKVLVAANGRTLYLFTADKSKKSVCYAQCAGFWPPLIAAKPTVGAGLKASLLGTTKRRGGKLQVTYGGHPLYFFAQDKKARRRERAGLRPLRRSLVGRLGRRQEDHGQAVKRASPWQRGGSDGVSG
jgi:predicted lipoprotein with Yx(FWY)xxD motif